MQQQDFKISGIVWHEVGKRSLDLSNRLIDMLNLNLHLKQYGEVLDWLGLIHIIDIREIYKPYKRHSKKKKYLYVRYKLDYQQFTQADDSEALEMMALSFLDVIEQFPKWKIKGFVFAYGRTL